LTIAFTSAIDTTGKAFVNKRSHVKKNPKLPINIEKSTQVGVK
jgi:hypothetical protein